MVEIAVNMKARWVLSVLLIPGMSWSEQPLNEVDAAILAWRRVVYPAPGVEVSMPSQSHYGSRTIIRETDPKRTQAAVEKLKTVIRDRYERVQASGEAELLRHYLVGFLVSEDRRRLINEFLSQEASSETLRLIEACLRSGYDCGLVLTWVEFPSPRSHPADYSFLPYDRYIARVRLSDRAAIGDVSRTRFLYCTRNLTPRAETGTDTLGDVWRKRTVGALEEIGDLYRKSGLMDKAMQWYLLAWWKWPDYDIRDRLMAKLSDSAKASGQKWRAVFYERRRLSWPITSGAVDRTLARLADLYRMPEDASAAQKAPKSRNARALVRACKMQAGVFAFPDAREALSLSGVTGDRYDKLLAACYEAEGRFYAKCLEESGVLVFENEERNWKSVAEAYRKALEALKSYPAELMKEYEDSTSLGQESWRLLSIKYAEKLREFALPEQLKLGK